MKELIAKLVTEADLSNEQAAKVAEVVRGFLTEKLPAPIKDHVLGALTGENIDNAFDALKGGLGGLFK
jgi:hypothetical protein